MKFTILQLDNAVHGVAGRLAMTEELIAKSGQSNFVILPELSTPGYIPTHEIWQYKEADGLLTKAWAVRMAQKYGCYIGCGYLEYTDGDYYNAYLIANADGVCGSVRKGEPEANIFKRGDVSHIIETPLGKIAVGICFDSHRIGLYNSLKAENPVLILMPHAWAMSVKEDGSVKRENKIKTDFLCKAYSEAFGVPVVFANARGQVEQMAGITGKLMKDYQLKGQSGVYFPNGTATRFMEREVCLFEADMSKPGTLTQKIKFYGGYIDKGSALFRKVVLPLDIGKGVRDYERKKATAL